MRLPRLQTLLLIILALSATGCAATGSLDNHLKPIKEEWRRPLVLGTGTTIPLGDGIFRVTYTGKTLGTAFAYNYKGRTRIISALHVFDGASRLIPEMTLINDRSLFKIKGIKRFDSGTDLCEITLAETEDYEKISLSYPPSPLPLAIDTGIFSINYSKFTPELEGRPILSKGYILKNNPTEDFIYGALNLLNKGGSGAPVLTKSGNEVVGIIVDRLINKERDYYGIVRILSAEKINGLLEAGVANKKGTAVKAVKEAN